MIGTVIANLARLTFLVLLQAFVLDHMDLANGLIVPYLYVLFLLMLPFDTPVWALLLIGFGTGFIVDLFSSTPGMHTSACLVLAFGRPYVLRLIAPRDGYEYGLRPTLRQMGLSWFLTYAGILVLVHHLWLFFIEVWGSGHFWNTILRVILSSAATLLLCLLAQLLITRVSRGRT